MAEITIKKSKMSRMSGSEKVFHVFSIVIMTIMGLICFLPCVHVFAKSISYGPFVTSGKILFIPKKIQFETMKYLLEETGFFTSLKNSLIVTILGTTISMFTTITTAYPLSKPDFPLRKFVVMLYVISMVFFGGIVPAYMVVNRIGILDTYAACILPFAIVQFNMFVVKSYFEGLPESVEEAARIDGASDLQTLVRIVIPMSVPIIATVALLYAINYWNNYFHAMMYTSSSSMRTLQVYLYDIINNGQAVMENLQSGATGSNMGNYAVNLTSEGLIAASVVLSIIPIISIYPLVQRYLVGGITIGSVKG